MIEAFFWYLLFQLIHLITLPFSFDIFRNLIDRGYAINKCFSFLMLSFIVYFFTRIINMKFNKLTILISLVVLFIFSLFQIVKYKRDIIKNFKELKKYIVISEILFILIFLLAIFFKSLRPDLDRGEGPMDFAYIQTIVRSEKLPPPYPWLINTNLENVYYYFGHFSYAIIIKILGIETSKGYILGLTTTFALIGLSSFSLGYNLTKDYKLAFLCMFLITFGSSLLSLFHLLFSINPKIQFNITEYRVSMEKGFIERFLRGDQLFWWSTRIIPWTITEFPWFSLLWGDLHAHFVSYIFIFNFTHLILNILYEKNNGFKIFGPNYIDIIKKILIFGISLGYMFPQFIWNYPLYVVFLGINLFFIFYDKNKKFNLFLYFLISFFLIIFFSILLYLNPIKNLLSLNHRRPGLNFENLKTSLFNFLVLYGTQTFFIYIYLFYKIFNSKKFKSKIILFFLTLVYLLLFFKILFNYFENTKRFDQEININWFDIKSILYNFQLIILLIPFTILPIYFLIKKKYYNKNELFLLISILFGALIVWIFEIFNIYNRYIFVFKLHQSIWVFWNISIVLIIFYFFHNTKIKLKKIIKIIISIIFSIFISSSIIYLIVTSISETNKFRPNYERDYLTIDCLEFAKQNYPTEYEAIVWINKNIEGNHVILEYPSNSYTFYPRPSTFTGLVAVVEWKDHADEVTFKNNDEMIDFVHFIFNSTNLEESIILIKKLNIEYVYIGYLERKNYSNEGLAKFENTLMFTKIYENDDVKIFKVV